MHVKVKREIIATLLKAKRPDLANSLVQVSSVGSARDIALMVLPGFNGKEVKAPDSKTMRFEFATKGAARSFAAKLESYGCNTVPDIWPGQKPAVIVYL